MSSIRQWYDDMSKAMDGSSEEGRMIYRRRQEWCKTVFRWIDELEGSWFDERYPMGKDGQDLAKSIFFINNQLYDEARSLVLLGQEVLDRKRAELEAEAKKHKGEEDETAAGDAIELEQARENVRTTKYMMRICESLWTYETCKRLDVDSEGQAESDTEGARGGGDVEEMLRGEQTPSLATVMDSEEFWSCMEASRTGGRRGASKRAGEVDIEELQSGFVKMSWYNFFGEPSKANAKTLYDSMSLPGWNRAYPAGPALMHDWLGYFDGNEEEGEGANAEETQELEHEARNERQRRRAALKRAAAKFFEEENIKSSFPMPLEVIVHRMQEVKLKEAIILLGKRLEFQGMLAVPICRWLTPDEIHLMEDQLTEAEDSTSKEEEGETVGVNPSEGGQNSMQEGPGRKVVVVNDDYFQVEKVAVNQAGFIFKAYKVRACWGSGGG